MKGRLLALILCFVILFNIFAITGCSFIDPGEGKPDSDGDGDSNLGGKEDSDEEGGGDLDGDHGIVIDPNADPDELWQLKLERTLIKALNKVDYCIESYDGGFPGAYSKDYVYSKSGNTAGWVQGFWTGVLWNAYEMSGDADYKELALSHVDSFYKRINEKLGVDNHDMGFLYSPSCVAAYKLFGNDQAKEAALMAADNLLTRYHADAGFIQAWGTVGDPTEYRLIIDCMMNMPLLFWASEVTGDEKYADAAEKHIISTISTIYREDGSTYHTYYFDPETKLPSHGATKQGFSDDSTWSRGQSWAMYGPVLAYSYNPDERYLPAFKAAADCFISNLPSDNVPYWDFVKNGVEGEPRDASAAAVAVCALLEGARYLDDTDPDKARYTAAARRIMESLIDGYTAFDISGANGILIGVTQNRMTEKGVEEMTPYGDYYFIEALHRFLDPEWDPYW